MLKINRKILIASILCIGILGLIRIVNIIPINIHLVVHYDSNVETKQASLLLQNEKKSKNQTITTRIKNNQSNFSIDPQDFSLEKLELSVEHSINEKLVIKNVEIISGIDEKNSRTVKKYTVKELSSYLKNDNYSLKEQKDKISFDKFKNNSNIIFNADFRNDFKKVIYKKSVIKYYLYALVLLIYIIYCLRITFFKRTSYLKYSLTVLTTVILLIFLGNIGLNYKNANTEMDIGVITEDPVKAIPLDQVITQSFVAGFNDLSAINLFLIPNESAKTEDVYVSIIDTQKNKVINNDIIYGEKIKSDDGAPQKIYVPKQSKSKGKSYKIILKSIAEENESPATVVIGDKTNELVTNMIRGTEQKNDSLVLKPCFERYNAKLALIIIIFLGIVLFLLVMNYRKLRLPAKWVIMAIYAIFSIYAVYQISYYHEYVGRTPDETAHISYLAYLEDENHIFVPDYNKIKVGVMESREKLYIREDATYNYLGHPPLYYEILHLAKVVKSEGNGYYLVKDRRLLYINIVIGMLGLITAFYIGYSRLKKEPIYHLLYASILTSIPMLLYGFSGVNNDNLTLLTVNIFFLGMLRFSENKHNFFTYLLIAFGINLTMWTKVTAGIAVVITGVTYLVYTILKRKNLKVILCKEFIFTIPLYLITFVYFILVYHKFGTFQPALQSMDIPDFYSSVFYIPFDQRRIMNFSEYIMYYFPKVFSTWTSIESHVSLTKVNSWLSFERIGSMLVLILPTIYLFVKNTKQNKNSSNLLKIFYGSVVITLILQFKTSIDRFYLDGYPGTHQTRYYLCFIAMLGFICVKLLMDIKERFNKKDNFQEISEANAGGKLVSTGVYYFCVLFSVLLLYGNFIYFLYYFKDYLI